MGDRHNRKRIRHRPVRRQRLGTLPPSADINIHKSSTNTTTLPPTPSSRWHPPPPTATKPLHRHEKSPESPRALARRIFGGAQDDGEDDEELCGHMLDVVLGLFGGVDYVDDDGDFDG